MGDKGRECFFIGLPGAEGAVADQFRALGEELAGRGHEVVFLAWGFDRAAAQSHGNPAIHTWPSRRPTGLRDALFLLRLIRRRRPRYLIGNFGSVNLMVLVGWIMRVPVRIAWCHTLIPAIELDDARPRWLQSALHRRKSLVYSLATHVVAVSHAVEVDVQGVHRVPAWKCRVMPNLLPDPVSGGLRPGHRRIGNKVVCVARFHPVKGQDVLIRALPLVAGEVGGIGVVFLGSGPTEDACKELARTLGVEGLCRFLGAVPHSQVLEELASAAVMVLPSRVEALSYAAIESQAVGTPVVASRVGGVPEVVAEGCNGLLVQPDDHRALAAALSSLLRSPQRLEGMSASARASFSRSFDLEARVGEYAAWLEAGLAPRERAADAPGTEERGEPKGGP